MMWVSAMLAKRVIDGCQGLGCPRAIDPTSVYFGGLTPFGLSLGAAASAQLTGISVGFNAGLHFLADALNAADPGLNILEFDSFGLLDSVINNPADYGFSNVTQPCFNGVAVCANPDSYLFWDSVHPTTSAHQLIGDRFTTTVPGPLVLHGIMCA